MWWLLWRSQIDISSTFERGWAWTARGSSPAAGYALERLLPSDEEQAWQELKAMLHERLRAADRGEVSPLSAVDVAEQVIREAGAT